MGSKTLKQGKRVGITRNQKRKLDYAAQAAAQQRKSGASVSSSSSISARPTSARLRKTNHNRGTSVTKKDDKRAEAKARQAEHDALTTLQKIEKLDKIFGKDLGAIKERAKLQKLLEAPKVIKKEEMATGFNQIYGGKPPTQKKKETHDKKRREERNSK